MTVQQTTAKRFSKALGVLLALLLIGQAAAMAHVKWFSDFSFADEPLTLGEAIDTTFLLLLLLSAVVIGALVYVDRQFREAVWFHRVNNWLKKQSAHSLTVMRVAAGAVLLLSWQADAMLVPEMTITAQWIGWFQFILALLLLFRKTVPLAGLGLILLYGVGLVE